MILAIDPGNIESAFVMLGNERPLPSVLGFGKLDNDALLERLFLWVGGEPEFVIEMVEGMGMAVGAEVFKTAYWVGRFDQAWRPKPVTLIPRTDVKLAMCGSKSAKDANIRQAIVDRYGGKAAAVGSKVNPGLLYGIKADCWQALAVGLTWIDRPEFRGR